MPTWVLNPKSQKPTPSSEEDNQVLLRGEAFEHMVQTVAWREILDFLEQLDEEAVAQVIGNKSSDPQVAQVFQLRLQERRYALEGLQHFVLGSIEQRKAILKQQEEEKEEVLHGQHASY